jgi:hypothetical protein
MEDLLEVRCPACDSGFPLQEPGEIECPCCGWEFACDDDGTVAGERDREGPFEVNADGEVDAEGFRPVSCTSCGCVFEVGEAGVVPCPRCRHTLDVDDWGQVVDGTLICLPCPVCRTINQEARATLTGHCPGCGRWDDWWDEEDLWDEFWADLEGPAVTCPNCGTGDDEHGLHVLFARRDDGRVLCRSCDWVFEPTSPQDYLSEDVGSGDEALVPGLLPQDRGRHPATLRVAPDGSADFRRIQDAINHAYRGAAVVIGPGRYEEQLVLIRAIEIRADGPPGRVTVASAGGPCLRVDTDRAEVHGLSFVKTGPGPAAAVEVERGRVLFEECSITSAGRAGVLVSGPLALPALRGCRIHDGAEVGVLVSDRALATLEDCRISDQGAAGIEVIMGGRLRVERCRVLNAGAEGVRVGGDGTALLQDSALAGGGAANLACVGGSVRLERCAIGDGRADGVRIAAGSAALVECRIRGNVRAGIVVGPFATLLLEDCELAGNRRTGLTVRGRGGARLVRCRFADNGAAPILLCPGAAVELEAWEANAPGRSPWRIAPGAMVRLVSPVRPG